MQPLDQLTFNLPNAETGEQIITTLRDNYSLTDGPQQTEKITFFDTFDWRLFARKRLCSLSNRQLHLTDFNGSDMEAPLPFSRVSKQFWWQLPASAVRNVLAEYIDIRSILPLVTIQQTTMDVHIVNKDQKVVAFVTLTEVSPGNGESRYSIQLREVRGYKKWFKKLKQCISGFGAPQPDTAVHLLQTALSVFDRAPLDYSSKFSITLQPDIAAQAAAKTIHKKLVCTMETNLQGIQEDLDSEFLHDFRVAIRRTRSALSLLKQVFSPEATRKYKNDFRFLGQITGPVRDLDVYLLMEEEYKKKLPRYLQEGLDYFFNDLARQRRLEQKKLVRALASPRFKRIMTDWNAYLDEDEESGGTNSHLPIGSLANTIITTRFKSVFVNGSKITSNAPDEDLHKLRIQGKKLRYCLEFFNTLYPPEEIKSLIRHLKILQNNLGDFNDLSVQQEMLQHYLEEIKPGTVKSKKLSAAIGGLLTNLYHEQRRVRLQFEKTFSQFAEPQHVALYKKLFNKPFFPRKLSNQTN